MKHILVVEDEQMLAKIIGMKLEEESYKVTHAYDGEQAYQALIAPEVPDLVLLDVLLPKMSGFDVLERLQKEKRPIPKVIVFSNFAQKADVERAHALGAVDYIVKAAFSPAEILSKINALFAQAEKDGAAAPASAAQPAAAQAPAPAQTKGYSNFASMEDVMPMSEVLHPGEETNNP
jgi:DNA-binding response OmpR family regulator